MRQAPRLKRRASSAAEGLSLERREAGPTKRPYLMSFCDATQCRRHEGGAASVAAANAQGRTQRVLTRLRGRDELEAAVAHHIPRARGRPTVSMAPPALPVMVELLIRAMGRRSWRAPSKHDVFGRRCSILVADCPSHSNGDEPRASLRNRRHGTPELRR